MRGSWQAISRGPYGSELLHQAWLQYAPMRWHRNLSIATTLAHLMASRKPEAYWETDGGKSEIVCDLENSDEESITRSLMTLISLCWGKADRADVVRTILKEQDYFEHHLFSNHPGVWDAAAWGWGSVDAFWHPHPSQLPLSIICFRCG